MDTTQVLLTTVILVLTVMLVVIGVQTAFVLRELRGTVERINKVLDDAGEVSGNLKRFLTSPASWLAGFKLGKKCLGWVKSRGS